MFEFSVKGPGEVTVGLVDRRGQLLSRKRLVLAGPDTIEAKSRVPLTLRVRDAEVSVVPVLIRRSNEAQVVLFGGLEHVIFTTERSKELKASLSVIERAARLGADEPMERTLLVSSRRAPVSRRR